MQSALTKGLAAAILVLSSFGATARRAAFVQRCERNGGAVVSIRRKALRFSALRR